MESRGLRHKSRKPGNLNPNNANPRPPRRARRRVPSLSPESVIEVRRRPRAMPRRPTPEPLIPESRAPQEDAAAIESTNTHNEEAPPQLESRSEQLEQDVPFFRTLIDRYGDMAEEEIERDLRIPRHPSFPSRSFHEHDYIIGMLKPDHWEILTPMDQWRIKRGL